MPPKVDQFLRRRETTLLQIKAIEAYANNLTDAEDIESVKVRMETLQRLMTAFTDAEDEIFARDGEAESNAVQCDDIYYKTIAKLNTHIKQMQEKTPNFDVSATFNNGTLNQTRCDIKLPRLTLPTFDGNYQEWQSYHDMFVSTVHENPGLTGVQKLQYLKDSLRGEARTSLRYLAITEANYIEAYQKLTKSQPSVNQATGKQLRQISDTSDEVIRGIRALGNSGNGRDPWLIYLILNKLDEDTQQRWASETSEIEFPTWQSFLDFITKRADSLENCQPPPRKQQPRATNLQSHTVATKNCSLCKETHNLYECQKFKDMDTTGRREYMQSANRCYNCLCDSHPVSRCRSKRSCRKCHKRHHTMLHLDTVYKTEENPAGSSNDKAIISTLVAQSGETIQSCQTRIHSKGLLQTALVNIRGENNNLFTCRALLDSGSLASFISEACVQKLGLRRNNQRILVEGLSSTKVGTTRGKVSLEMYSRTQPEMSFNLEGLILPVITSQQPQTIVTSHHWEEFNDLDLADPTFDKPGDIELLIGCDLYLALILPGHIKSTKTNLIAQETVLGWIISGTFNDQKPTKLTNLCTSINIDQTLTRFWEIEEIKTTTPHTQTEIYCENHFLHNYRKNSSGRFLVALPFDPEAAPLGESKSRAIKRLQAIERRLAKNTELKTTYTEFMREYQNLGHMERIPKDEIDIPWSLSYYLPHHFVYKETSTTTKLRVVFDGSSKTTTGRSLNQNLLVGPQIQQTLQQILLRFRFHRYVMTADLEKMFRQVLVSPPHTEFQRILWREEPTHPIQEYRLLTVTYGTASASFLSTRVLKQIAEDNRHTFERASTVIERDFYVDDLMTGTDTLDQLIKLKQELASIMEASGFNLRKWLSNCLPNEDTTIDSQKLIEIDRDLQYSKVLGIYWNTLTDVFTYRVALNDVPILTKRGLLSESSRLFDPQGWLAPLTIYVKILFQQTWAKALDWDDPLPHDISENWCKLRNELMLIEQITIPRWLNFNSTMISLHGFSDASQKAYAAVVYAVCSNESGEVKVTIVSAKTKVAPVQKQITIPRLELCAALLLSKLMKSIQLTMGERKHNVYLWSDSEIVLAWIATIPRSLDIFLGNRVSEIISTHPRKYWYHITSKENPADCASRGILPSELTNHHLWWTGPKWLSYPESEWPSNTQPSIICNVTTQPTMIEEIINKYSNLNKVIRQLAYCKRFINNCRLKSSERLKTFLTCSELNQANELLIKYVQEKNFSTELKTLKAHLHLNKNHKLINLNLFIDQNGILRVGGRICHATIPYDVKHPILLPPEDDVTEMLVRTIHEELLCGNHTLLHTTLKRKYWIINCKLIVRRVIKRCIKCSRHTSKPIQPLMGDLPPNRVTLVRPFLSTGVDYAGPIYVRPSKRRGLKPDKAYIAIFVCLSTKAVHLELAGDLSTDSCIAALRRFISRRGLCHEIISDNGSNFIGAKNDLNKLFHTINDTKISNFLSQNQINWRFNPPTGSHFGGLYEAAVKSIKYHLKRTLGQASLTYEEMTTVLTQIEAILNSRPLCITSKDDINPLTPAHFLIGHPFTYLPENDLNHLKLSHLSRWQYIQRLRQDFYKKWHSTYLMSLQRRTKWQSNAGAIELRDIVLLHEQNIPRGLWRIGRVVELHPGRDGIVRVVTVETSSNRFKRPVNKLSVLPVSH